MRPKVDAPTAPLKLSTVLRAAFMVSLKEQTRRVQAFRGTKNGTKRASGNDLA